MLAIFTTITEFLGKFSELSPNKQVVYLMGLLLSGFVVTTYYFYNKHELEFKRLNKENLDLENEITILKNTEDSLYKVIYDIKVEELNKDLRRSDSLLQESENLKKSMNPVIKNINQKIDEIDNP